MILHRGSSRPICLLKIWPPLYYNHKKGESTGKILHTPSFRRLIFPFPVVTPPPLPINWYVNGHSFYWNVQTRNIEMFSAFINTFSNRLRVAADPLDQYGCLSRSHCSLISYTELSFVVHFSLHTKKQLVHGICYRGWHIPLPVARG